MQFDELAKMEEGIPPLPKKRSPRSAFAAAKHIRSILNMGDAQMAIYWALRVDTRMKQVTARADALGDPTIQMELAGLREEINSERNASLSSRFELLAKLADDLPTSEDLPKTDAENRLMAIKVIADNGVTGFSDPKKVLNAILKIVNKDTAPKKAKKVVEKSAKQSEQAGQEGPPF